MKSRIPVVVISGFLGSGKTTFLRYLINSSNENFGLLINEFGDVGIDGDLIRNSGNCNDILDECIIELNNGCLCCTVQDDFIPAIEKLLKSNKDLKAIIIESSGLSLPIPLIKALNWPEIRTSIYLDLVIGIVNGESMLNDLPINNLDEIYNQYDGINVIEHKSNIDELFQEQLEVSDLILISRADILKDKEFQLIQEKIYERINSNVPIIKAFNGQINLDYIFEENIKKNKYQEFIAEDHTHNHPELFSDCIKIECFIEKKSFEQEMAFSLRDLNILRIKGRAWIKNKLLP